MDKNKYKYENIKVDDRKRFWENMIKESFVDGNISHLFLAKIKKYLPQSQFVSEKNNYLEKDYTYTYLAKNSPTGVYSSSAIHEVNLFSSILKKYIKTHQLPSPGHFERNSEIMRSLDNLPCAIPKEQIVIQAHLNGEIDR